VPSCNGRRSVVRDVAHDDPRPRLGEELCERAPTSPTPCTSTERPRSRRSQRRARGSHECRGGRRERCTARDRRIRHVPHSCRRRAASDRRSRSCPRTSCSRRVRSGSCPRGTRRGRRSGAKSHRRSSPVGRVGTESTAFPPPNGRSAADILRVMPSASRIASSSAFAANGYICMRVPPPAGPSLVEWRQMNIQAPLVSSKRATTSSPSQARMRSSRTRGPYLPSATALCEASTP
jgi:hypothetical protein